jgi:2-dehydropantoate 2-reductase
MKSFAIIGTGAVGGYYGGLLQKAGQDVHFLLHSDYEFVKQHGLTVESVNGDFCLPHVNAYQDPKQMPRCDVAIVSLKTTANGILKNLLPHVLKDDGVVLTLQNGLGSEKTMAEIVGPGRVIGGLCFLCSNKVGPGHIRHLDYGMITLGEYRADGRPGGITPRLEQLGEIMESAGIPIQRVEDLPLARWKKLAAASAVCARPIEPEFIEKMMAYTEQMLPYAPSMKLDFDRGNPLEIESIYGNPIRAANAAGVSMPETEELYRQLKRVGAQNDR